MPSRGRAKAEECSNWSRIFPGDTYRAVYTVRFADVIYVLHAFQKKSTKGIATAATDIAMIRARLRLAHPDYADKDEDRNDRTSITRGSGNVFADLGLPDAAERQTKTRLALALNRIIKNQGAQASRCRPFARCAPAQGFGAGQLPARWLFG